MEELVHGQGKRMEKTRCFYTTCPKCPNIMARTTWSPWQGCSSSLQASIAQDPLNR